MPAAARRRDHRREVQARWRRKSRARDRAHHRRWHAANDPKYDRLARETLELTGRLRMRRFGEGWPLMTGDRA